MTEWFAPQKKKVVMPAPPPLVVEDEVENETLKNKSRTGRSSLVIDLENTGTKTGGSTGGLKL